MQRTMITTAELAEVLGLGYKSVLTMYSRDENVRGLVPAYTIFKGPDRGHRWAVREVRAVLMAPVRLLDELAA